MTNLADQPPQSNTKNVSPPSQNDGAKEYLRREIAELAWALGVQTEILSRYCELGQDDMICHSVRQIRAVYKALYETTRRLHELKREGM